MKTIALAVMVVLMLAPGVLAEETFNPNTGKWEDAPEMDIYNPHEHGWNDERLQDETWSDDSGDGWEQRRTEDEWSGSREDEWKREQSEDESYSDAQEEQWHREPAQDESWSPPAEIPDAGPPPWVGIPPHDSPDRR